jgi:peroxiredoxin
LKLRSDYTGKGLKVVFISLDFPEEVNTKLIPFLKKNNVDFTTFYGDFKNTEEIMDYFDKKWDGAIPATFIFDKKGILRSKIIGNKSYDFYQAEISKFTD